MQLLRKYIAYARQHVFPVLSDEAKEILQVRFRDLEHSRRGLHLCFKTLERIYGPGVSVPIV